MITLLDPLFWISFFYFWIALFLAFFIPGDIVLGKKTLSFFQRFVIATVIGMILWGLQGILFGYLGIRWASYVYLIVVVGVWVLKNKVRFKNFLSFPKGTIFRKADKLLVFLIVVGTFIQVLATWFTGLYDKEGLFLCCFVPDSLYHLALSDQLVKNFPPFEPGMYGEVVRNYHYLSNMVVAELVRVFHLPLLHTQFQYSIFFISLFLGLSAIVFTQVLQVKKIYTRFLIFFLYFYGDIIFFITFLLGKGINFNMTLQENATTLWSSPPRVFALIVFFVGSSLLFMWCKSKKLSTGIVAGIILGSIISLKVYIGFFVLSGLGFLILYMFFQKKNFMILVPFLFALSTALLLYFPVNKNAGGIFFSGFWRIEDFAVTAGFGLSHLELARRVYEEHGNVLRVFQYEAIYLVLYISSLLGVYLLAFFQTKKSLLQFPTIVHVFLLGGIIPSTVIGMFFLQKTGGANTAQFLFMFYVIGALYTALVCSYWLPKLRKNMKIIALLLLILFTVPRVVYEMHNDFKTVVKREMYTVPTSELQLYQYIEEETKEDSLFLLSNTQDNIFYYTSVLANRPMYLVGAGILTDHGIDTTIREEKAKIISQNPRASSVSATLLDQGITYVYIRPSDTLVSTNSAYFLKQVFQNEAGKIYQVDYERARTYLQEYIKEEGENDYWYGRENNLQ